MTDSPVTQDELHAYVDNELAADRREAVEAWLANHPDDAATIAQWRAQAEAIRAHHGSVANEPVPARFDIDRLLLTPQRSWRTTAAAAVIALLIGGAGGWFAHGASATTPTPTDILTHDALSAHKLYVAEVRHPIEVRSNEQHLIPWLSRRIGTAIRAPDLGSFELKLLGGRLLPGPSGPAALFMYEGPTGERYTFYASKTAATQTSLRYNVASEIAAVHWVETQYGYAVSGPANKEKLLKIAQTVYEQMDRAPARAASYPLMSRRGS